MVTHGAHIWSKPGFSICWRHLVTSQKFVKFDFFSEKTFLTLYVRNIFWDTFFYKYHGGFTQNAPLRERNLIIHNTIRLFFLFTFINQNSHRIRSKNKVWFKKEKSLSLLKSLLYFWVYRFVVVWFSVNLPISLFLLSLYLFLFLF